MVFPWDFSINKQKNMRKIHGTPPGPWLPGTAAHGWVEAQGGRVGRPDISALEIPFECAFEWETSSIAP